MKQSMDKLSLGNRMKLFYEQPYQYKLPMRMPVLLRLDGRAFHTFTRGLERPFDESYISLMQETMLFICNNIQNAVLAYSQSDEISILIHNYKKLDTQAWFGNEVQKMVSISAGLASSYFTLNSSKLFNPYTPEHPYWTNEHHKIAQFDSRVFVLPETEVCNYFIWRQQDWERNSIQMLGQSLYSHSELQNKNNKQIQEMCFQKGTNWNNLNTYLKRGSCVYKTATQKNKIVRDDMDCSGVPGEVRYEFRINNNIPIFTKDREFIERWLEVEED